MQQKKICEKILKIEGGDTFGAPPIWKKNETEKNAKNLNFSTFLIIIEPFSCVSFEKSHFTTLGSYNSSLEPIQSYLAPKQKLQKAPRNLDFWSLPNFAHFFAAQGIIRKMPKTASQSEVLQNELQSAPIEVKSVKWVFLYILHLRNHVWPHENHTIQVWNPYRMNWLQS